MRLLPKNITTLKGDPINRLDDEQMVCVKCNWIGNLSVCGSQEHRDGRFDCPECHSIAVQNTYTGTLEKAIFQAQDILARYVDPEGVDGDKALNDILGVLDDSELVKMMRA